MKRTGIVAITALVFLVLAAPASAGPNRPHKGQGAGQLIPTDPSGTAFAIQAAGQATHFGQWTMTGELFLSPISGSPLLAVSGVSITTAANGDVAVATFAGRLDPQTGRMAGQAVFVSEASLADGTVVSSTGRFADVRGTVAFNAVLALDLSVRLAINGTIAY